MCAHDFGSATRIYSPVTGKQQWFKYWCLLCGAIHYFADNQDVPTVDQVAA
jgi:hypothetical protein